MATPAARPKPPLRHKRSSTAPYEVDFAFRDEKGFTVGVDAGCLGVGENRLKVGVYQFAFSLLDELSRNDRENEYWLYSFTPIEKKVLERFGKKMRNKVLKPKKGWLTFRLSWEFLINRPDIFLGFGQALPFFHPLKSIVFVYDLSFEYFPECYPDSFKKLSWQTRHAARTVDRLVAISQSTKDDLVRLYGVNEEKIELIYPGVDPVFKPQSKKEISKIRKKYALRESYFLFVGSLKPGKNIPRIIEAFAKFLDKTEGVHQLVLAGSDFWLDQQIAATIKKLKLGREIKNLSYVSRKGLPALYSGARAFIAPSLYEGFGLPLVESMACGTPVITSNAGSMPEVVGEAGILVNPQSSEEIVRAMLKLESQSAVYDTLSKKGREQARKFSWKKAASQLLDLMERF